MEITGGRGADVAIDLVPANPDTVSHAMQAVRTGGTVVLAGIKGGDKMATLDTDWMIYKEVTVRAVFAQGSEAYAKGLDLLTRNLERIAPMHTHEMPLEQAALAIEMLAGEVAGEEAICVSLHPSMG